MFNKKYPIQPIKSTSISLTFQLAAKEVLIQSKITLHVERSSSEKIPWKGLANVRTISIRDLVDQLPHTQIHRYWIRFQKRSLVGLEIALLSDFLFILDSSIEWCMLTLSSRKSTPIGKPELIPNLAKLSFSYYIVVRDVRTSFFKKSLFSPSPRKKKQKTNSDKSVNKGHPFKHT